MIRVYKLSHSPFQRIEKIHNNNCHKPPRKVRFNRQGLLRRQMVGRIRKTEFLALSRQNSHPSSQHRRNLPDRGNPYWTIDCKHATGTYDKDLLCGLSVEYAPQILTSKLYLPLLILFFLFILKSVFASLGELSTVERRTKIFFIVINKTRND